MATEAEYRAKAKELYNDDGTLEVDASAAVSIEDGNPDGGAYVQAWVWVSDVEFEGEDNNGNTKLVD